MSTITNDQARVRNVMLIPIAVAVAVALVSGVLAVATDSPWTSPFLGLFGLLV